jgi:hypothetical protein
VARLVKVQFVFGDVITALDLTVKMKKKVEKQRSVVASSPPQEGFHNLLFVKWGQIDFLDVYLRLLQYEQIGSCSGSLVE